MASLLDGIKSAGDSALGALGIDPIFGDGANLEGAYFASSQLAHRMFGQQEIHSNGNSPFLGFQYFVKFNFNSANKALIEHHSGYLKPGTDYAPIIQSIDMPSMSVSTDKLNEYNRWRISQTNIEYEPVKMSVFDSVSGSGLGLWKMYYYYYFKDAEFPGDLTNLTPTPDAWTRSSSSFGYHLEEVGNDRYLITSIDIFQIHQNKFTKTRLHNPRISDFSHGELAYEDSGAVKLDFTFEYESVSYMDRGSVTETDTPDIWEHLADSNVPKSKNVFTKEFQKALGEDSLFAEEGLGEQSLLDDISNIKNPKDALNALKRAKSETQEVLGAAANLGAQFNQIQMDITGKDTPIIEAPSVRNVSAVVNTVPTGYSDIRRASRKVQGD